MNYNILYFLLYKKNLVYVLKLIQIIQTNFQMNMLFYIQIIYFQQYIDFFFFKNKIGKSVIIANVNVKQ